MFQKLINVFRIPDLRNKLLFTVALLCVYRIGFYVTIPGVDAPHMRGMQPDQSAFGMLSAYMSVFTGGDLFQGTIFGLGIMPYISASIIIQLMGTVTPAIEKLRKEGEPGMRKINEWTRYLAVGVCLIQSVMYVWHFHTYESGSDTGKSLYTLVNNSQGSYHLLFLLLAVVMLTAGSIFLMWLGEQIEQFGIGNGVSLIITAGIVSRMPVAVKDVLFNSIDPQQAGNRKTLWEKVSGALHDVFSMGQGRISFVQIIFLIVCFVFVVGAAIFLTQAQRRIPVQQAKHMRGRRVYGGAKQYLPLRVNHSGVMPIIFAGTLLQLPMIGIQKLVEMQGNSHTWFSTVLGVIQRTFAQNGTSFPYEFLYCVMIFFFSYFWNTVQFQPKEMANQLRDYGSFIPGLRPGKRTADYLENVMTRITYVGAAFLCVIAVIPNVVGSFVLSPLGPQASQVSQFLGGTGLLIVISVMLDFVNRIEANLVMRNYGGFLDDEGEGPSKVKRPKGGPSSPNSPRKPEPAYKRDDQRGLPA